jgi:hypothetical protein
MNWELYEVWQKDLDQQEFLVDTTRSLKEARKLAEKILIESLGIVIIFREADDIYEEIERLTISENGSIMKKS